VWGLRGFLRRSHTTDGFGGAVPPAPTFERTDMSKQWGHGYHTGFDEGYEGGYERGISVPAMIEAEQMDVLIETMARLLGNEEIGPRHWSVLRTMSEVNAKNMLNADRAWHERAKTPNGGVQAPCAASCARSPGTKC